MLIKKNLKLLQKSHILSFLLFINQFVFGQSPDMIVVNKVRSNANMPGSLAFVEFNTGKIIKTVAVGNEPHEVCVSDDKRFALVTNTGSYKEPNNTLSLIDIPNEVEKYRIDLGPLWNPHGTIFHNGLFYFTAEGSRTIGAYDPEKNKLVWLNGTGQDQTHMLAMTKNGKKLISTNRGSGTISIFELMEENTLKGGAWKETIIKVGRSPEGLDINPDESKVFVGCAGKISIVDLEQKKETDSIATGENRAARIKFTLDGKYVLGTAGREGMLLFIDVASHKIVKSLPVGAGAESIFILPDGKHVMVSITNEDLVAEIDLRTMEITRKLKGFTGPDAMAWLGK